MRRTWSVAVARDARPAVWTRVGEVLRSWSGSATVTPVGELMWLADTGSATEADALASAVVEAGAEPLRSSRTVYEEQDYAAADLLGVTGVDLSLDPPFASYPLGRSRVDPPCARCGHQDAFDVTVTGRPRIREAMLDAPDPTGALPAPYGWEVVNLPNGGLLLSSRLVARLRAMEVRGLITEEVLDARGNPSRRMAAVRAPVAVLTPCAVHTQVDGAPYCPVCGTAHGSLDGSFWMPRSVVGDAEFVSRHPHRAAMICLSPRVLVELEGVPGVRRGDPFRVCED